MLFADVYTRANTAWVFLVLGIVMLLIAYAKPTFHWCIKAWTKGHRRRVVTRDVRSPELKPHGKRQ